MSSSEQSDNLHSLSLDDVRLMSQALGVLSLNQPTFFQRGTVRGVRSQVIGQTVAQHSRNYPSLDPEKNKYDIRFNRFALHTVDVALLSLADAFPVYNDGVKTTSEFNINSKRLSFRPGLEQDLFEGPISSDDMQGDIQRLQEQLGLAT